MQKAKKAEKKEAGFDIEVPILFQIVKKTSENYLGLPSERLTSMKKLQNALGNQITIADSSNRLLTVTCTLTLTFV